MTVLEAVHEAHGATFTALGDRQVVDHYGRPDRTHQAVHNGVGVTEPPYGVVVVEGDDRVDFVDNAVSNRVPTTDGNGCYALLLDPQGGITTDMYVFTADGRLLVFLPPTRAGPVAEDWDSKTFIQDVEVREATDEFAVFGVHGPKATEKIASVLNKAASPATPLSFVRGSMRDTGVTVVRDDDLAGEEGFLVVCAADAAEPVFDTLVNRGVNAVPFGYRTWSTLTLEAGTPLFETELEGEVPNVVGVRNALDFEKGCYVGQEVVSRVENRGRPSRRLVGLRLGAVPEAGAAVFDGDSAVGEVTRGAAVETQPDPVALALVEYDAPTDLAVRVDGTERPATVTPLPFGEGAATSARLPAYPDTD